MAKEKKKGFIGEFKEFISRGSVMDLAVGVIMGSAFTAIVTSLVNDIIMPAVGCIIGRINFSDLKYVVTPAAEDMAEAAIYYGNFIQSIVNFLLIALVVFSVIKLINRLRKKAEKKAEEMEKEKEAEEPNENILLLREIRDLLKRENE